MSDIVHIMATTPGMRWDTEIVPLYERDGVTYTAEQLYRRYGNSKLNKWNSPGIQFIRRMHCGKEIEKDVNGYAYCPVCSKIFNAGGKAKDGDRAVDVVHYADWGPPLKKSRSRKRSSEVAPQVAAPVL